jgi:hypothetical protein
MANIEVDFDVYKALTLRRETESMTYNAVLRQLLQLGDSAETPAAASGTGGCVMQGVHLPEGTEFRVIYKGMTYTAVIKGGRWIGSDGHARRSPSDAATAITGNNVNGWRFWSYRTPGNQEWRKMRELQERR